MTAPTTFTVGDRYRDRTGNTHIVTAVVTDGPSSTCMLLEDFDLRENPTGFEWDTCTWGWANQHWGPLEPIESDPELTRIVTERAAQEEEKARIVAAVPPDQHRDLYNAIHACGHYNAKMAETQEALEKVAADRAREIRRLVGIVGTQDKAAKLLGINQSSLSRALRPRGEG